MNNELAIKMKFIGLLTAKQKEAGYFVSQDEDFIWVWHGRNNTPNCVAILSYEFATVRQVREAAQKHLEEQTKASSNREG